MYPSATALELRRAFDAAFAEAPATSPAPSEDLLAFRLAGDPYAVRLRQIGGLFKDRRLTLLPSPVPELLGVAGIRGSIVPVCDLRALLGYPPAGNTRWLLLTVAPEVVGMAFEAFEGQLRVRRESIVAAPAQGRRHVSEAVQIGDVLWHVVDVASVVEAVTSRARTAGLAKER
jgi:chemotaxis signal transduction protein